MQPGSSTNYLRICSGRARRAAGAAVCARSGRVLGAGPPPLPLLLQDREVPEGVRGGPLRRRPLQARVPLPAGAPPPPEEERPAMPRSDPSRSSTVLHYSSYKYMLDKHRKVADG